MKYAALLALLLIAWLVIDRLLSKDRDSPGAFTLRERWRDLRSRIHIAVGIIATLILLIFFVRLVFHALAGE